MMFTTKRGDTKEPLMVQLLDGGEPIDLTGCKVRFLMQKNGKQIDEMAEIRDDVNGIVWYAFRESDVDTVDLYKAEFEVEYEDFRTQTYPKDDYISVNIIKDLG